MDALEAGEKTLRAMLANRAALAGSQIGISDLT